MTDIETSNSQDPVAPTGDDAASTSQTVEQSQDNDATHATPKPDNHVEREQTLAEKIHSRAEKIKAKEGEEQKAQIEKKVDQPVEHGEQPPKFEPNYKYKAFGKEKELDPFFRDLIKDAQSEKKVKDVFTRADAFDDMKQRYEGVSQEFQNMARDHQDLDRDVKRVMHFRNAKDFDNFFAMLHISKDDVFGWAAKQLELEKMGPEHQQQYQQGVQARAENLYNQQNYATIQQQMADQRAQLVQMQLDQTLGRSEFTSAASAWDQKMGPGEFRRLVISEAANNTHATGQVWSPEQAVQHVMMKFGRLLDQPQPQASAQAFNGHAPQPQMGSHPQQPVMVQGRPVIPNVKGQGTSPIKQAPKSLDQLREMSKALQRQESAGYEASY